MPIHKKPTAPSFFDVQTHINYTFINNTLSAHAKKPKIVSILCPPLSYFTHLTLEIQKESMQSPHISSLLFALAYQQSALDEPPYTYELYFTSRAHLFDEQKCMCECFFYHKTKCTQDFSLPKTHIITCDIFLPCALSALNIQENFITYIESYLCYFQKGMLKEILPCKKSQHTSLEQIHSPSAESNQDELYTLINAHIIYLQEAYHQHFTHIYYLMQEHNALISLLKAKEDNSFYISAPHINNQTLHIAPLSHICEQTRHMDLKDFRAILALHYALIASQDVLPNFAPKPHPHKKLYYALAFICAMFMCIIPLSLFVYNHTLQRNITELNAQSEALFIQAESPTTQSLTHDTLQSLAYKQEQLVRNLEELYLWQQNYNQRYMFVQEILNARANSINYEDISFYFSPNMFLASLQVSAQSQVHISTLLAHFHTNAQVFLQDSIIEDKESAESPRFYAHIIVVRYAI